MLKSKRRNAAVYTNYKYFEIEFCYSVENRSLLKVESKFNVSI